MFFSSKGADGNFYTNAARSRFPSTDGWVIAAGSGQIHPLELIGLDNIRAHRWWRSETQVDLTIDWYLLERTEVDRESAKTPRASPYPPGYRDPRTGRNFIRYYLAHIRYEGYGWSQTFSLPRGGIIAPMVCIRWEEGSPNNRRVVCMWLPNNLWAPMPGMNDCLGLTRWMVNVKGRFRRLCADPLTISIMVSVGSDGHIANSLVALSTGFRIMLNFRILFNILCLFSRI